MRKFNVLDPDTYIFGHFFLEASAGTGKTFAIENIVPRLILESDPPLSLSQILIVTFTRAATRELKSRIYTNLLKVEQSLSKREDSPRYLAKIYAKGPEAIYAARRKIEEAICSFEEAQIFTLHGFCLRILQEFAFEAQFFIGLQESGDNLKESEEALITICDFIRSDLRPPFYSPSQIKRLFKSETKQQNLHPLCQKILSLLQKGKEIQSFKDAPTIWEELRKHLQMLPKVTKSDLWTEFRTRFPKQAEAKKWTAQAEEVFSWVEQGDCSYEKWDNLLLEKNLFLEELNFSLPSAKNQTHTQCLNNLQTTILPLWNMARNTQILLLRIAKDCSQVYERSKLESVHFEPDDLVRKMQQALSDPIFCQNVQNKYKAAIIDEFQDTDPIQWNIFKTLFLRSSNSHTLYLVGDPKQSIYAFRYADVYTYLEALSIVGEDHLYYLNTNYRSHPDLITALNDLFTFHLPPTWMQLPSTQSFLEINKVESRPVATSSLELDILGRMHFFIATDRLGREKKWPKENTEEEKLFPFIASEIQRLCKEKGFRYQQIAILVKDRYQANRLQLFLKNYDIPCFMQKSLDIKHSAAYEAIRDLIQALLKPSCDSSLKKVLGGCIIGKSSDEIVGKWENSILLKAREYFSHAASIIHKQGFGIFFQNFLTSTWGEKTIAEELISKKDSSLYFELRQICQLICDHKPEAIYDTGALYAFFENLPEFPPDHPIFEQAVEEEEDQVVVMTIHKSKGLEFDIVFALGLCCRQLVHNEILSVKKQQEHILTVVPEAQEEHLLMKKELDAEKMRQLYVALTRAKERVYVPIVFDELQKPVEIGAASPIELFCSRFGQQESVSFEAAYENLSHLSLSDLTSHLDLLKARSSLSYTVIHDPISLQSENIKQSYSSLSFPSLPKIERMDSKLLSFTSLSSELADSGQELEKIPYVYEGEKTPHTMPIGAETGILLHAIFEEICKADLHRRESERIQECIQKHCKHTLLEGWEDVIQTLAMQIFSLPITSESTSPCLRQIPAKDMQVEMEFMFPYKGSLLKGFIDLVFRHEGKYYLLDWKTNFLGRNDTDYSFEAMQKAMLDHHYFLQASIYASALKKYMRLFETRDFNTYFGGVIYVFLRGRQHFFFFPQDINYNEADFSKAAIWHKT